MTPIELKSVMFGASVYDPSHSKVVNTLNEREGYVLMFDPESQLLMGEKNGFRKLYPITNIKEMVPKALDVSRETIASKKGRKPRDYSEDV